MKLTTLSIIFLLQILKCAVLANRSGFLSSSIMGTSEPTGYISRSISDLLTCDKVIMKRDERLVSSPHSSIRYVVDPLTVS
jgi:hypothetical protein